MWPGLPAATLSVPPEPLAGLCLASLALIWLCLWRSRIRFWGIPPLVVAVLVLPLFVTPPDILVSPDLRMIAFRQPEAVYLEAEGHDDFTLGEWRRFFGGRAVLPFPSPGLRPPPGGVLCSADGCVLPGRGGGSILLWRSDSPPADCRGIAVAVTTGYWDDPPGPGCAGLPVIDRDRIHAGEATAVWLARSGVTVRADRPGRGDWPWLGASP